MAVSSIVLSLLLGVLWIIPWLSSGSDGKLQLTGFSLSWKDDKMEFLAGDVVTILVKPWGESESEGKEGAYDAEFSVSVRGKKGNSSYVSDVHSYSSGDPAYWNITFVPITVGEFTLVVTEERSGVSDASLHFSVLSGPIHPSACVASWANNVSEYVAGTKANVLMLPKDAFGNNISSRDGPSYHDIFSLAVYHENGTEADILEVNYTGWDKLGYLGFEFIPATAGSLLLSVSGENITLRESPLPFKVKPGSVAVNKCQGKWKYGTNALQIFSKLEFLIYQQDQFGNVIPDFYPFDALVIKKGMNLSIPVSDIFFSETKPGIQLLSFVASEPGDFMLVVFDDKQKESIAGTPHEYTVFVGYCHASNSVVNGSGLLTSVAGQVSEFTVYLEDMYHNPFLMGEEKLLIQILRVNDSIDVQPTIFPIKNITDAVGPPPESPTNQNETSTGNSTVETNIFKVAYKPEKYGTYEIWVLCGNILLNNGQTYSMIVSPGVADTSISRVMEIPRRVKGLVRNEVVLQLVDSYRNPISSNEEKLRFKMDLSNNSSFSTWKFMYHEAEGLYISYYLARHLGSYNICISFEDICLSPSPIEINVYRRDYFPEANNDSIAVWEDGSVAFNVLTNDYHVGTNATIINSSTPSHGTLLQYGELFRYTPFKGFSGNDSFSYEFSDVNNNVDIGTVTVSILLLPPQFVSLPTDLHATEDTLSPKFGGFPGFSLKYSDSAENISLKLSAKSGSILLAPIPLQIWPSLQSKLYISRGSSQKDLHLAGGVEVINSALKLIQYLGNENFYGVDILSLYATNKNGMQDAHVTIYIEPVNDPPFIQAPNFINIDGKEIEDGLIIFDKQRDPFEFLIGDPDLPNFPGNKSYFLVTFSVEVNEGLLVAKLPDNLLYTVELKMRNSYHWQQLQNFVTISKHFTVKGKGIRFRGTIDDCNCAMQQLLYQGPKSGVVLTVSVNDMGNYGSNPDHPEKMSMPLSVEAMISIIKRKPISIFAARFLGSAIVIEFIFVLLLGGVLLFFLCKCTSALRAEGRIGGGFKHSEADHTQDSVLPPTNTAYFTTFSNSLSQRPENSNFRQRSTKKTKSERSPNLYHQQITQRRVLSLSIERSKGDSAQVT